MVDFFQLLAAFFRAVINKLNSVSFSISGYNVTLAGLLFAFLVFSIVISVFWKGGKA